MNRPLRSWLRGEGGGAPGLLSHALGPRAFWALALAATAACSDSATGPEAPPALSLDALGSAPVSAEVGSQVTLSVRVVDEFGAPLGGVPVYWGTGTGSGQVLSEPTTATDASGYASAVWALGTVAGTQRAFATAEGREGPVSAEFVADVRPGPAAQANLAADSVLLSARGETAFLGPTLLDAYGNPTPSGQVAWRSSDPSVVVVQADGLVTGVGPGTAWVVPRAGPAGQAPAAATDSIQVTVELRGAITVTFDDGFRSVYEHAWPVFRELGLPANVGVYTEAVGWPGFLSEAHLDELHAAGWSMVSHSVTHDSLPNLTPSGVEYELRESQAWLDARGYQGSHVFVAPYHAFGEAERIAASRYYVAARGTSSNAFAPDSLVFWMPDNPYQLTGIDAEALPYTTPDGRERLRGLLQRTRDEGRFLDVYFHRIPAEHVPDLRATLEVVAEFRDRVLPYHQLFPRLARSVF